MADINEKNGDAALIELQTAITSIFQDVESGVDDEISAIRSQIEQIQQLLKDAIASLYDSFESLNEHTSDQMKLMSELIFDSVGQSKDVLDGYNIFQRTDEASKVLRELVEMIIKSSEKVLQALTTMDEIKPQIKSMNHNIKNSGRVLSEMAMLAEDEDIDRAQLILLINQAKENQSRLSKDMGSIKHEFTTAHQNVSKSAKRDMKDVYAARVSVEDILNHLYGINDMLSESRSRVTSVNGAIRQDLGTAIRALQFEDIVSQSLGHTELHLNRMFTFVELISQGASAMQALHSDNTAAYTHQLTQLQQNVTNYRQELRLEDINPVSQQNMDEGDVDLF